MCVCVQKDAPTPDVRRHAQHGQKEGGITTSKLVPDARTTMTLRDLTSEIEWDRVLYSWYGRALLYEDAFGTLSLRG